MHTLKFESISARSFILWQSFDLSDLTNSSSKCCSISAYFESILCLASSNDSMCDAYSVEVLNRL